MTAHPTIQVYLTGKQKAKLLKKSAFQMSHKEVESGEGMHHVEIEMPPQHYNNLLKNAANKKGFRFKEGTISGCSVMHSCAANNLGEVPKEVVRRATCVRRRMGENAPHADMVPLLKNVTDAGVAPVYSGSSVPAARAICVRAMPQKGMLVGSQSTLEGSGVVGDVMGKLGRTYKKGVHGVKAILRNPQVQNFLAEQAANIAAEKSDNPLAKEAAHKATLAAIREASKGTGLLQEADHEKFAVRAARKACCRRHPSASDAAHLLTKVGLHSAHHFTGDVITGEGVSNFCDYAKKTLHKVARGGVSAIHHTSGYWSPMLGSAAAGAATVATGNPVAGAAAGWVVKEGSQRLASEANRRMNGTGITSYMRKMYGARDKRFAPTPKDFTYVDQSYLRRPDLREDHNVIVEPATHNPMHKGGRLCVVGGRLVHGVPRPVERNICTGDLGVRREHGTSSGICNGMSFAPM